MTDAEKADDGAFGYLFFSRAPGLSWVPLGWQCRVCGATGAGCREGLLLHLEDHARALDFEAWADAVTWGE